MFDLTSSCNKCVTHVGEINRRTKYKDQNLHSSLGMNVQIEAKTEKPPINQGDRLSANVENQHSALWIRANRGTNRRTED
jgi:hypothetical protein